MTQDAADRIRDVSFSLARRGYDREEVESFLSELAAELEGVELGEPLDGRAELGRVGERTAEILTKAHDVAEEIRVEAEREAEEEIEAARAEAEQARGSARAEADEVLSAARSDADRTLSTARSEAQAAISAARDESQRLLAEAQRSRSELAAEVADLEAQRDSLLDDLEQIARQAAGAALQFRDAQGTPGGARGQADAEDEGEPAPA